MPRKVRKIIDEKQKEDFETYRLIVNAASRADGTRMFTGDSASSFRRCYQRFNEVLSVWLRHGAVPLLSAQYLMANDDDYAICERLHIKDIVLKALGPLGPNVDHQTDEFFTDDQFVDFEYDAAEDLAEHAAGYDEVNTDEVDVFLLNDPEDRASRNTIAYVETTEFNCEAVLQKWFAESGSTLSSLDLLLKYLHVYKPTWDYDELPKSSKQLVKIENSDLAAVLVRDFSHYDWESHSFRETVWSFPNVDIEEEADDLFSIGRRSVMNTAGGSKSIYMHFGIEQAVMGDSIGMVYRDQYARILQMMHSADPSALTEEFSDMFFREDRKSKFGDLYYDKKKMEDYYKRAETDAAGNRVRVVIDMFIDAVQLFKNSADAQAHVIMGRIHYIGKYKIPIRKSPPFLIGIYHGNGKPELEPFLYDVMQELKSMNPFQESPPRHHKCLVFTRLVIADAPMRAFLKGIPGHAGFWSCERCRIRGMKEGRSGMRFPDLDCPHRSVFHWYDYTVAEEEEPNPDRKHARERTPFWDLMDAQRFDLIRQFVIDSMHTIDGGITPHILKATFGIRKHPVGKLPENMLNLANSLISLWRKCTPGEFQRRIRSISMINSWKMNEGRQFLLYISIPLFYKLKHWNSLASDSSSSDEDDGPSQIDNILEMWKHLVLSVRLIAGDGLDLIPEDLIRESEHNYIKFFNKAKSLFGDDICSFKMHAASHIPGDARNHRCHVDSLNAYPFENMMRIILKLLRNGQNPLKQIARGLALYKKYRHPEMDEALNDRVMALEDEKSKFINNNHSFSFDATSLIKIRTNNKLQKAICEGVDITNTFPNCIVEVVEEDGGQKIVAVDNILHDDGKVMICGTRFLSVQDLFSSPYPSRRIGVYLASLKTKEEDRITRGLWEFNKVKAKFFPFPLHVRKDDFERASGKSLTRDEWRAVSIYDLHNPQQKWIFVRELHCEMKI